MEQKIRNFNGVTSTALPRLELIPKSTLESLGKRMELGIKRKGDGAWNALTHYNSEALVNSDFVIERLSHCIHHCYDAIRKIVNNKILEEEDDAGAILFAGSVLAEYKRLYASTIK